MRLGLAEALARRVQRDGRLRAQRRPGGGSAGAGDRRRHVEQRLEVGEPPLRLGQRVGDDDEEPSGQAASERCEENAVARPREARNAKRSAGRGNRIQEPGERGKTLDGVEQVWKRHVASRQAARAAVRSGVRARPERVMSVSAARRRSAATRSGTVRGRRVEDANTAAGHAAALVRTRTPRARTRPASSVSVNRRNTDSSHSAFTTSAPARSVPRRKKYTPTRAGAVSVAPSRGSRGASAPSPCIASAPAGRGTTAPGAA